MSEEGQSFWLGFTEKILGIVLIVVSILMFYFTFGSADTLGAYIGLFGFLGVVVLAAGAFLVVVKPPE
jgi:hypothetical protein